MGDMINLMLMRDASSSTVITLALINFGEALWAASIHPEGEVETNFLARFIMHSTVNFVGMTAGIRAVGTIPLIKLSADPAKKRKLKTYFAGSIALCLITPYLTGLNISVGLGEVYTYTAAFQIWRGIFVDALSAMSYGMASTTLGILFHYLILLYDLGHIYIMDADKVNTAIGHKEQENVSVPTPTSTTTNENINKRGDEQKRKVSIEETIKHILVTYRFNNKPLEEEKVKSSIEIALKLEDIAGVTLARNLVNLQSKINDLIKSKKDKNDTEKEAIQEQIRTVIRDMWSKSTSNGEGFGTALPKVGKTKN
jgi:hypothetical protein